MRPHDLAGLLARRYRGPAGPEVELPKGDVTEGVVRVGDTVRRPHQPQSWAVAGYLDHLERAGFDGAPRFLGLDDAGRDVLSYLPGQVAGDPVEAWAADEGLLVSVGELVRSLHAASTGYLTEQEFRAPAGAWARDQVQRPAGTEPPAAELVAHCDVTPQNVVVRDGRAVALVDFDLAGPTSRLTDVVNTAFHWVPLRAPEDVWPQWAHAGPGGAALDPARRLRLLADGYGLSPQQRLALPDLAIERSRASRLTMQTRAEQLGGGWARMWREGVGDLIHRRELWLRAQRPHLLAVLG